MRNYTDITILLDRSGSMSAIHGATVEGINNFITEQKSVPGDGCWSLVCFDDPMSARGRGEQFPQVVWDQIGQDKVPILERSDFQPRGDTALIDAFAMTVKRIGERLRVMPESQRPSRVIMVIMTDGNERCSTLYTRGQLAEMVAHQESAYGWNFIYLGANQDAFATSKGLGIQKTAGYNYECKTAGVLGALNHASHTSRQYKLDGNDSAASLLTDPTVPDKKPDVNVNVTVTK